ncbi:hypothetical protein BASA83_002562 [Batrachochytrium salamandrivorans]|nr:hypothetical protein BASA83_002562 [Batrachochytrium salamandrivorans]
MNDVSFFPVDAALVFFDGTLLFQGGVVIPLSVPVVASWNDSQIRQVAALQIDQEHERDSVRAAATLSSAIPSLSSAAIAVSSTPRTLNSVPTPRGGPFRQTPYSPVVMASQPFSQNSTPLQPSTHPLSSKYRVRAGLFQCWITKNITWSVSCKETSQTIQSEARYGSTMHVVETSRVTLMGCVIPSQLSSTLPRPLTEIAPRIPLPANMPQQHDSRYITKNSSQALVFANSLLITSTISPTPQKDGVVNSVPFQSPSDMNSRFLQRYRHSSVLDSGLNRIIVFGGIGSFGPENTVTQLNLTSQTWSLPRLINASYPFSDHVSLFISPYMISCFGLVYSTKLGKSRSSVTNLCSIINTVTWKLTYPRIEATPISATISTLPISRTLVPLARTGVRNAMVFVPILNAFVVFGGGRLNETDQSIISAYNDLWTLHTPKLPGSITWIQHKAIGLEPPPRLYHSVALVASDTIMVWGGVGANAEILADGAYFLNLSTWEWTTASILTLSTSLGGPTNTSHPRNPFTTNYSNVNTIGYIGFAFFLVLFLGMISRFVQKKRRIHISSNPLLKNPTSRQLCHVSSQSFISYNSFYSQELHYIDSFNTATDSKEGMPRLPGRVHTKSWSSEKPLQDIACALFTPQETSFTLKDGCAPQIPLSMNDASYESYTLQELIDMSLSNRLDSSELQFRSTDNDLYKEDVSGKSVEHMYPNTGSSPSSTPLITSQHAAPHMALIYSDESRRVSSIIADSASSMDKKQDVTETEQSSKGAQLEHLLKIVAVDSITSSSSSSASPDLHSLPTMCSPCKNLAPLVEYDECSEGSMPSVQSIQWIPFEYDHASGFQDLGPLKAPPPCSKEREVGTESPILSPRLQRRTLLSSLGRFSALFGGASFPWETSLGSRLDGPPPLQYDQVGEVQPRMALCDDSALEKTKSILSPDSGMEKEPTASLTGAIKQERSTSAVIRKQKGALRTRLVKSLRIETRGLSYVDANPYRQETGSPLTLFWPPRSQTSALHCSGKMPVFGGSLNSKTCMSLNARHLHPLLFKPLPNLLHSTSSSALLPKSASSSTLSSPMKVQRDDTNTTPCCVVLTTEQMRHLPMGHLHALASPSTASDLNPTQSLWEPHTLKILNSKDTPLPP